MNTYPIEHDEKLGKMGLFSRNVPTAPSGKSLVLVGNSEKTVLYPNQKPTRGEIRWGNYHTAYTVDMATKFLEKTFEVDSKDPLEKYKVSLECSIVVNSPIKIIENYVTDAESLIFNIVSKRVERVTSLYSIDQVEEAKEAVLKLTADSSLIDRIESQGFEVQDIYLKLNLSDSALLLQKNRREEKERMAFEREREKMKQEFERELELQRNEEERERQRMRQQFEKELEMNRLKNEQELERERATLGKIKVETELSEKEMKANHMKKLISESNDKTELMMIFSENKEDILDVLKTVRQENKEDRKEILDMYVKLKQLDMLDEDSEIVEFFKNMAVSQTFQNSGVLQIAATTADDSKHLLNEPKHVKEIDIDNVEWED
ncbi:hypothetical protein [Neobacillus sp. D3-1R]|uniref:hypothetical protein n=1 Tax=Neobacillus sp. D3-1R TaxID=3445778 RepID=UPI003FA0316D